MKFNGFRFGFRAKWSEALAGIGERLRSRRQKRAKGAEPPPPRRPQATPSRFADKREEKGGLGSGTKGRGALSEPRSRLLIPSLLALLVLGGVFFFKGGIPGTPPVAPGRGTSPPFEGSQPPPPPPPPVVPAAPPGGTGESVGGEPPSIVYGVRPPTSPAPAPASSQLSLPAPVPATPSSPLPASEDSSAPSPAAATPSLGLDSSTPTSPSPFPTAPSPDQVTGPKKSPQRAVSPSVPSAKKESEPGEGAQGSASDSLTALLTPDLFAEPATNKKGKAAKAPVVVPPPPPPVLAPPPSPPPPPRLPSSPPTPAKVALPVPPKPAGVLKGDGKLWVLLETANGMGEVEVGKDTFQRWRFESRRGEIYAITKAPASKSGKGAGGPQKEEVVYRLIQTESGFAWNLRRGKP